MDAAPPDTGSAEPLVLADYNPRNRIRSHTPIEVERKAVHLGLAAGPDTDNRLAESEP